MRLRWLRGIGATSLLWLAMTVSPSCSSQQEGGELETSQEEAGEGLTADEEASGEDNENFSGGFDGNSLDGGHNELLGGSSDTASGRDASDDLAGGLAGGGDNDLANIINELNDQPAGGGAPAPAMELAPSSLSVAADAAGGLTMAAQGPAGGGGKVSGMAGTPAGPGLPELGSKLAYIVRPGDTLGKISAKIFGNPKHWKKLAKLSNIDNPSRIFPGDVIYYQLSAESLAFATEYENAAKKELIVQNGDTMETIAAKVYGSRKHWKFVWRQNEQVADPDNLEVGTPIYLVGVATPAKIAKTSQDKAHIVQSSTDTSLEKAMSPAAITVETLDAGMDLVERHATALEVSVDILDV